MCRTRPARPLRSSEQGNRLRCSAGEGLAGWIEIPRFARSDTYGTRLTMNKTTFALFFGNRGFFPASLIASAREEMRRELRALGHDVILLDAETTRYGAVETPR